jgi:hypothetical protein
MVFPEFATRADSASLAASRSASGSGPVVEEWGMLRSSGRRLPAAALCSIVDEASDTVRTLTWRQSGSVEAAISAALRAAILLGLGLRNSERTVELSI